MKILDILGVNKSKNKSLILDNINLSVKEGSIIALVGKNGAGKTSLLKIILELYRPNRGVVKYFGKYKKVIFDELPNMDNFTVKEYLNIFNLIYTNKPISKDNLDKIISLTNLEKYLNKKLKVLSFGMKKKLYLSTIFLGKSDLIVMDEPFNGLDFESIEIFREAIKHYQKETNCTIIISSHHLQELYDICNEVCIVSEGRIVNYTKIEELKTSIYIKSLKLKQLTNFIILKNKIITNVDEDGILINWDKNDDIFSFISELVYENIQFEEIYFKNVLKEGIEGYCEL